MTLQETWHAVIEFDFLVLWNAYQFYIIGVVGALFILGWYCRVGPEVLILVGRTQTEGIGLMKRYGTKRYPRSQERIEIVGPGLPPRV